MARGHGTSQWWSFLITNQLQNQKTIIWAVRGGPPCREQISVLTHKKGLTLSLTVVNSLRNAVIRYPYSQFETQLRNIHSLF